MPVFPDAAHEEVETARLHDGFLICFAFGLKVGSVAVEDVYVTLRDVDMVEEVIVHERVVAFGMVFRNADVFVHVEGDHVLEGDFAVAHHADEFGICAERGGACGKAEHERLVRLACFFVDLCCYMPCGPD